MTKTAKAKSAPPKEEETAKSSRKPPTPPSILVRWLSSESLPAIFDYSADRVHSRGLSIFLFAVSLLFIFRAALFVLFLTDQLEPPLPALQPQPVVLGQQSSAGATIGATLTPVTSVLLLSPDSGSPMARERLALTLDLLSPATDDLTPRFGYAFTLYDYTGLPVNGRYGFPGFVPRLLRSPLIVGGTATTGSDGVARFRRLSVALAVPGSYAFTASVPQRGVSIPNVLPMPVTSPAGDGKFHPWRCSAASRARYPW